MSQWLKQSTAVTVVMGPFVDATDGATPEIALDITEQEVLLSKNGGAFTLKHETTHGVHDASHNGWYTILLDTTDTNTLGLLDIAINMAGALPVWKSYMIVTADAWDSFLGAVVIGQAGTQAALVANNLDHLCKTATAAVDMTTEVTDGTIISRIISNSDTSLYVPATSNMTTHAAMLTDIHDTDLSAVKTDTAAILLDTATIDTAGEIAAAVWSADATTYQTQGTFGQAIGDPVADTNSIYKAVVTDATGATVGVDVVAVKAETATIVADTNELQTDWVNGGRLDLLLDGANPTAIWDFANGIETGLTPRQAMRLFAAALAGKVSGAGTVTVTFRNAVVDGTDRIVATVDANGNRTAIAYDLT